MDSANDCTRGVDKTSKSSACGLSKSHSFVYMTFIQVVHQTSERPDAGMTSFGRKEFSYLCIYLFLCNWISIKVNKKPPASVSS